MEACKTVKTWTKTSVQNLVRHKSGRYYARLFSNGKETWKSLKTDLLEVAKVKLREHAGEQSKVTRAQTSHERGKMTVGDCSVIFRQRLLEGFGLGGRGKRLRRISEGTQHYREQTLKALWKSWPDLEAMDVRKTSVAECERWAKAFAAKYSASRYNNTLDTLRALFRIAVEAGARVDNPAEQVGRIEVKQKSLVLPEREQFQKFVETVRTAGAWCSKDCADFIQFIAFTGARKTEAANVCWSDIDFTKGRILFRVTKGGRSRYVPLISDAKALLERMRSERTDEPLNTPVLRVNEAQKAMDSAAEKVGFLRITHHDLRHLFATTCIESGVDIPTISRWLGHRDGGALAMKTYGHLRDEHSMQSAKRVSFSATAPENTVPFPSSSAVA